jgi:hypothetical protein
MKKEWWRSPLWTLGRGFLARGYGVGHGFKAIGLGRDIADWKTEKQNLQPL